MRLAGASWAFSHSPWGSLLMNLGAAIRRPKENFHFSIGMLVASLRKGIPKLEQRAAACCSRKTQGEAED
jgi:hypothetical protein